MLKKKVIEELLKDYRRLLSRTERKEDIIYFTAKIETLELVLDKQKKVKK